MTIYTPPEPGELVKTVSELVVAVNTQFGMPTDRFLSTDLVV
jgi:hypothetical protein